MRLLCENCEAPINAEDVNLESGLARCRTCHAVFRFEDQLDGQRPDAPRPASITAEEGMGRLTYRHRWFSPKYFAFVVFLAVWFGFLAFWYIGVAAAGAPLLFSLFPLIHVAAGVFLAYLTLAGFLNTTVVELDRGRLSVRHGPLPWPGGVDLSTQELRQLYCEEKVTSGKNGPSYSYQLHAVLPDGSRKKLLSGLDSPDVPRYLEQRVEEFLRIRDERVAGEFVR
jgi:hypothetical protein